MAIGAAREGILDLMKEHLGIIACGSPVLRIAQSFELLAQWFEGVAICNLLMTMEPAGFVKNLALGGYTRRYFLRRFASDGEPENELLAISRTSSFFAAITAGAFPVAKEIAALSPRRWHPDGEYEDDYAYFAFFHNWVLADGSPDTAELEALLKQLLTATEGAPTPRSAVCEAFLKRNAGDFAASFADLLSSRQAEMKELKPLAGDDLTFEPRSAVFVEGLALLALADMAGFPTEDEYELCPGAARIRSPQSLPHDLYEDIDALIRGD